MSAIERWLPVANYEGIYEVSSEGRLRSLDRTINGPRGLRRIAGVVLRPAPAPNGYLKIALHREGQSENVYIHRLVAQAFVDGEEPGLDVCHADGSRTNNAASNLRWGTRSENNLDAVAHGTHHWASRGHCKRGHALAGGNLYIAPKSGQRVCLACNRERGFARRNGIPFSDERANARYENYQKQEA